ncbi:MAG TPA: ABC transporter permease [Gammaproteobacteria bacterium]|nr:ABC transporter permease [Gammaproteobacteria bacterium]
MRWLEQILEITWMSLATIPQRLGSALVIVGGIAGVVGVLVALLAIGEGFQAVLAEAGRLDDAIVLRKGASAELNSGLSREDVVLVAQAPGILRDKTGNPIASAEVVVVANLPKRSSGTDANVEIRGVGQRVWELRSNARIIEGRRFETGKRELVIGKAAQTEFAGLEVGRTIRLGLQDWTVVGVFASGDAHESELWSDPEVLQGAYNRDGYQSVTVKLTDADAFDTLKAALSSDPRLKVDVQRTRDYYATQSEDLTRLIRILGVAIAAIMGVGAVFGALNTMYAAVSARSREIATLRALGFSATPVVISVMLEAALLALVGGVIGAGIAWAVFDNYTASTLGANFSQVVFAFQVSPQLILNGLLWALGIGLLGGLFPAVHAARQPVTSALRAL